MSSKDKKELLNQISKFVEIITNYRTSFNNLTDENKVNYWNNYVVKEFEQLHNEINS